VSNKILSMTSRFGSIYSDSKYRAERSRTSGRANWKEIKHGYLKIMVEIDHDVGVIPFCHCDRLALQSNFIKYYK